MSPGVISSIVLFVIGGLVLGIINVYFPYLLITQKLELGGKIVQGVVFLVVDFVMLYFYIRGIGAAIKKANRTK